MRKTQLELTDREHLEVKIAKIQCVNKGSAYDGQNRCSPSPV
jgi:hypothetical protein